LILLGVSGSIAAYKAVDVLRLLTKAGQDVHVLMTEAATRFVGPLTFRALSGHEVLVDVLDPQQWRMAHLDLSEKANALVVAPASADLLSQLACGGARNILTASALAMPRNSSGKLRAPVILAPAMHTSMWLHPATRANVKTLKGFGYQFIGPESGPLGRLGDEGVGRMADPQAIASVVLKAVL
jgi:phosphopantothenoylcysteine decarboxylase/phosphopantothenate--cysteine ligase